MLDTLIPVLVFLVVGTGFVGVSMVMARMIGPYHPSERKQSAYECGEEVFGKPWIKIHIRYYIFALLFLIFDMETVFLFPWAVVYKQLGVFGLVEMFIFIVILVIGLIYPWRKGVLRWVY